MRNNVNCGDGVYKTSNCGEIWIHLGLKEVEHISQVRSPQPSEHCYVDGFRDAFSPNTERDVLRTKDGEKT